MDRDKEYLEFSAGVVLRPHSLPTLEEQIFLAERAFLKGCICRKITCISQISDLGWFRILFLPSNHYAKFLAFRGSPWPEVVTTYISDSPTRVISLFDATQY